ncbi:unnamed protein product [Cyprideis torosa]|uniref:Uncharacterized protein n=1 Tax=Cyprideis torosa TaxID=163714 RepID=A0A7R8ZM13_9CRUS|nr:unnamed protein product [Cyprideis torosa]CAG0893126.1 unnamed protein product [Cyprideis torosa]
MPMKNKYNIVYTLRLSSISSLPSLTNSPNCGLALPSVFGDCTEGTSVAFPLLDAFLLDKQLDFSDDLKESIAAYLGKLTSEFEAYFDGVEPWYKDPFGAVVDDETEEAEELLYACTECSKTFTYPSMLQKHRRIHSGERKYDCPICARSFATWDNRHVHMFAHTKKRLYECKHCGEGFMRKAQARLHVDHMHREYALEPLADSIRKNKPFKYLGDGRIVENYDTGDEGRVLEPGMKTTTYPKADPNEVITHVVGKLKGPCERPGREFRTPSTLATHKG